MKTITILQLFGIALSIAMITFPIVIFWKRRRKNKDPEEKLLRGEELFHLEKSILVERWCYITIDQRTKRCKFREERRNGLIFLYWSNDAGIDIKMLRSDGEGYMQMVNQVGQIFGAVMFGPGKPDEVMYIPTDIPFSASMRWFIQNHS